MEAMNSTIMPSLQVTATLQTLTTGCNAIIKTYDCEEFIFNLDPINDNFRSARTDKEGKKR